MKKQFIAKLLVLAMVLALVPATFLAVSAEGEGTDTNPGCNEGCTGGSTYVDTIERVDIEDTSEGIQANVIAGTASVTLTGKTVEALADNVQNGELVLEIKCEGATKLNVSMPATVLAALAKETGAALTIKSDVVTITIPNEALTTELGAGSLRISAKNDASGVSFSISAAGRALQNIKGLKVEF